jgi:hypothetical protein
MTPETRAQVYWFLQKAAYSLNCFPPADYDASLSPFPQENTANPLLISVSPDKPKNPLGFFDMPLTKM